MRICHLNPYIEEAVLITRDLGDVTFVGAVAIFLHTKKSRESQDLDFVMVEQVNREKLLNLKYRFNENGKEKIYTSRNYKIDIYDSRELNDIPLRKIIDTRAIILVDKKGTTVNAICLEGLIVTKHRANRDQDHEDLSLISMYCYRNIDWKILKTFTENDLEFRQIVIDMKFYKETPLN